MSYFGGGISRWTTAFSVAAGIRIVASTIAKRRPVRECRRLCGISLIRSLRDSSGVCTAARCAG